MFRIIMRGGVYFFDIRFRIILQETILERKNGILIDTYENILINLEDVYGYEDENMNYIEVNPPIID